MYTRRIFLNYFFIWIGFIFVSVNKILTDLKQIEEFDLEPVVNIRKDVTRRATGGIRATVQPKNKIYT